MVQKGKSLLLCFSRDRKGGSSTANFLGTSYPGGSSNPEKSAELLKAQLQPWVHPKGPQPSLGKDPKDGRV